MKRLKNHFVCYGIPTIVVSDNGPQFHCEEFCNFAKSYGFMHRTNSPRHPQSNGMVEVAVTSAKKIISRAVEGKKEPHLAILAYRKTPQSDGLSPAQKFLGRRTRNSLQASFVSVITLSSPMKWYVITLNDFKSVAL